MDRKKALFIYLVGTIGQIVVTCAIVFGLRNIGLKIDSTTISGLLAIAMGGTSSAVWGVIVVCKYKKVTLKEILIDFIDVRQNISDYVLAAMLLLLEFCYVLVGGKFQIEVWYMPVVIFLKAILFGGIEEIGWRYTFQPVLEEKSNYVFSTIITFVCWGIWHMLYFYIEGSLYNIQTIAFLMGLITNCFILSSLYNKTKSLWICVMTHALINTFSQISYGGNLPLSFICNLIIIIVSIVISYKNRKEDYHL